MRSILVLLVAAALFGCFRNTRDWDDPTAPSDAPLSFPKAPMGRQTLCAVEQIVVRKDHAILVISGREERLALDGIEARLAEELAACKLGPGEPIFWADGEGSTGARDEARRRGEELTVELTK